MDDDPAIKPEPAEVGSELPEAVISAQSALRALLALLAIWTFFSGIALILFQNSAAATIGGGEGDAAQRLLGVHLLVLAPLYGLLAWDPKGYRLLLWVPYAAQGGVVVVTARDMMWGHRDVQDGILPLLVSGIFLVLLVGVWRAAKRPEVAPPVVAGDGSPTGPLPDVGNSGDEEGEPVQPVKPEPD